ncbi:uncharacterized protein LOC119068847 isoform X2 [Bradysia coprophila]|uniref:uncharacterized protein LOC119068847 isoform X2 n=1 Tax=Bradysia coprophila TaxID=38358 RepID=UPI00187DC498|nr:uncharacterized protein LOC119068847 isoform X2 [Bradysia coprophila]
MNNFLKENGLDHAIPTFTYHKMEMDLLNDLTENDIKELLPAIGDQIRFKEGLQKMRDRKKTRNCRGSKPLKETPDESSHVGNDAKRKEIAVQTLISHKKLTEKLCNSVIKMIADHVSLSFYLKHQNVLNKWDLINYRNASLNCPFCTRDIALRYRPNTERFTWNICSFQRHLDCAHSNLPKLKLRAVDDNSNIC